MPASVPSIPCTKLTLSILESLTWQSEPAELYSVLYVIQVKDQALHSQTLFI